MWNKGAAIRPLMRLFVMAVRREAPSGAADVTLSGLVLAEGLRPSDSPTGFRLRQGYGETSPKLEERRRALAGPPSPRFRLR
jgi:hypothetical protein